MKCTVISHTQTSVLSKTMHWFFLVKLLLYVYKACYCTRTYCHIGSSNIHVYTYHYWVLFRDVNIVHIHSKAIQVLYKCILSLFVILFKVHVHWCFNSLSINSVYDFAILTILYHVTVFRERLLSLAFDRKYHELFTAGYVHTLTSSTFWVNYL